MRYDIQRPLFYTKQLFESKSIGWSRKLIEVNLRTEHVQRKKLLQNYQKNLKQPKQYLIYHLS